MKKILVLLLAGFLVLAGCAANENSANSEQTPQPKENKVSKTGNETAATKENETLDGTFFVMDGQKCKNSEGNWNGSDCLCGGVAGSKCPEGFCCTDYLPNAGAPDAMGTCKLKNASYNLTTEIVGSTKNAENKTETEKNSDGLQFGGYIVALDDIARNNGVDCAALSMFNKTTMELVDRAVICPGRDYYWVAPNGHKYRIVVSDVAAGYTKKEIWAKIFIYG